MGWRYLVGGPAVCPPPADPDEGRVFSDPIAFAVTDASGAFVLDRPPGIYRIEVFSDDFSFRPSAMTLESPIQGITIVAEPL